LVTFITLLNHTILMCYYNSFTGKMNRTPFLHLFNRNITLITCTCVALKLINEISLIGLILVLQLTYERKKLL